MKLNLDRFEQLRLRLFEYIEKSLKEDSYCKIYEGQFSIIFPHYFDKGWRIRLDCYIFGPFGHYEWIGKDFEEAFNKAEKDINNWLNDYDKNS